MRLERAVTPKRLISLTPLIDVVFLLLVFFMLTASFLEPGVVTLDARESEGASGRPLPIVRLTSEGELLHQGRPATPAALAKRLSEPGLRLESAREVPLQRLIDTVEALEAAGFKEVAVGQGGGAP